MSILLRPVKLNKDEKKKYPGFNGIIIIVYSDVYFDLFYTRHCAKKHEILEFTVIVVGEKATPVKENIKEELKRIMTKELKLKKGTLFAELSAPYFARIWSLRKNWFIDEVPDAAVLRFENCDEVSYADLETLRNQGAIIQADIDAVRDMRSNAEKNKLLIKVWFIGHTDVIKSRR